MAASNDSLPKEQVLIDDAFLSSVLTAIKSAKTSIDIEMYIFNSDQAGEMISDALCAAAKRGVKIRILVDGIGTPNWGNAMTIKMENCGITSKVYHPTPWIISHWQYAAGAPKSLLSKFLHFLSKINSRNHRKIFIIDNSTVYIGSANITNHLIANQGNNDIWRETSVKVIDINPDALIYSFERTWLKSKPKNPQRPTKIVVNGNTIFHLNYTWKLRHIYYKDLLTRLSNANSKIWVTNSYFVPDNRLLRKLINASKNGVDVRILLPSLSDVMITSIASKMFYTILLNNDVSIYEYLPRVLHAKSLIIDDWYLVGSSNLNYRSIRHDLEADAEMHSNEAKEILLRQFEIDLNHARKISQDDANSQPLYLYLLGRIILFFRYWI